MTDHATTAVTTLLAATEQQGPGNTLRIVLLVSMVGGALLAWFLLRGYGNGGNNGDGGDGAGRDGSSGSAESAEGVKIVENEGTEKDARDANA